MAQPKHRLGDALIEKKFCAQTHSGMLITPTIGIELEDIGR